MRNAQMLPDGSRSAVFDGASYSLLQDVLCQKYSVQITVSTDNVDIRVLTEGTVSERHLTVPLEVFLDIVDFFADSHASLIAMEARTKVLR